MDQGSASGFSIDLASLRFFADALKAEAEAGLQPGVERARREALIGVPFGHRAVGGELAAGVEATDLALARARDNVARQIKAAEILFNAAQYILTEYGNADIASAEQLAVVEWTLSEAAREATAVYSPPSPRGMLP